MTLLFPTPLSALQINQMVYMQSHWAKWPSALSQLDSYTAPASVIYCRSVACQGNLLLRTWKPYTQSKDQETPLPTKIESTNNNASVGKQNKTHFIWISPVPTGTAQYSNPKCARTPGRTGSGIGMLGFAKLSWVSKGNEITDQIGLWRVKRKIDVICEKYNLIFEEFHLRSMLMICIYI